ncbi:MAG: hypothetical protein ACYDCI_08785 [Candidatus Limnocylindrales bacterium]
MKLERFRAPALAATAFLLISGAGIAFAGSPAPTVPVAPTTVTTQQVVGVDTGTTQQGDQTTPDVAPVLGAPSTTSAETSAESATEPAAADSATAESATEPASAETDGPGGHVDPAGTNVDHQFDGQE